METKTVRELTREKLERALGKSGNPHRHNVDDILDALEAKNWDIRNRQGQTLANTLAKCETIEALMKVSQTTQKDHLVKTCYRRSDSRRAADDSVSPELKSLLMPTVTMPIAVFHCHVAASVDHPTHLFLGAVAKPINDSPVVLRRSLSQSNLEDPS